MSELVAWKGSNGMFSRWHVTADRHWTTCGKEIPTHPAVPPTFAPMSLRPSKIAGICGTCDERRDHFLRLER